MKKNILLIAAALFLFLGNQSVTAQAQMKKNAQSLNTEKIKVSAQKKTQSLVRTLGLSDEQQNKVYQLFVSSEKKMTVAKNSGSSVESKKKSAKMEMYINQKMKDILDEDQYTKYVDLVKNNKL